MRNILSIWAVFICVFLYAQKEEYRLIDIQTNKETIRKDSISSVKFLDSLSQNRFFFTKLIKVEKKDNKINIFYDKGQDFNQGFVKISDTLSKELKYDKIFFTKNIDSIKKSINQYFIDKGFAFSRVKTKYAGNRELFPIMELSIIKENKRKIDNFVLKGYEKVPKRFIKNLEKQFLGQDYNAKTLLSIHQALKNHQFIGLEKTPQTLFTKDFTSVFLFTQKKKANYFDGIVGFGNDRTEKLSFNGTLNLQFRNIFNAFESISFYWQRNADKGQTFDLEVDIPYVMKSNLGIDMKINIFRQDSSFANAKILPSVYYHIHNSQKIGLRGTLETSSVINQLYASGKDYNKQGLGFWYEYSLPADIELFIDKIKLRAEADWFSVKYVEDSSAKQNKYYLFGEYNLPLKGNHWLNMKGEMAMLSSDNELITNELFRFGGWKSMRGFNENSLYSDFYYYTNLEYRYLVNNQSFFDIFVQYGGFNNKILNLKPRLYSFGLGFNMLVPIGLLSFQISNGNEFGNALKFRDTKIHWGIVSRF